MKRNLILLGILLGFLGPNFKSNAQQLDNGWPKYFSTAWAYQWSSNAWVQQGRIKPKYDANKNFIEADAQGYISGNWISVERNTFTSNSKGQVWVTLDEKFNGSTWDKVKIDSFTYNADGTQDTRLVSEIVSGNWAPTHLHHYHYDANKVLQSDYEQDRNGNKWENDDYYYYYYYSNGSLDRINDSNWVGSWSMWRRDTVNYNADNSVKEVVSQECDGTTKWTNVSKITFDSALTTGIASEGSRLMSAHIYPNPSTGFLQVELPAGVSTAELSVYDLSGRLVMYIPSQSISGFTMPFDLGKLQSGNYFLVCNTNKGILQTQIVKQ